jgi:hypothetical protein
MLECRQALLRPVHMLDEGTMASPFTLEHRAFVEIRYRCCSAASRALGVAPSGQTSHAHTSARIMNSNQRSSLG